MPITRQPKRPGPPLPGLRLSELRERSCRWPLGAFSDPPVRFCGAATAGTSPYCSEHTERAFSGVKSSRPAAPPVGVDTGPRAAVTRARARVPGGGA
jgi:hypothetical protein